MKTTAEEMLGITKSTRNKGQVALAHKILQTLEEKVLLRAHLGRRTFGFSQEEVKRLGKHGVVVLQEELTPLGYVVHSEKSVVTGASSCWISW